MVDLAAAAAARIAETKVTFKGDHTRFAIIDDVLPNRVLRAVQYAFATSRGMFTRRSTFRERKSVSNAFDRLPPILTETARALQSKEVIAAVRRITGFRDLVADPTFYAGGLSMMGPGDYLNPHIDNSHDGQRELYRRINLLLYVKGCGGGELELWNQDVRDCDRIEVTTNRLVLMETNRTSWHSVAPVVRGIRCCVSTYFFTPQSPDGSDYYHVTSFTGRPGQIARRAFAAIDNGARQLARTLGAGRASDWGFRGATNP